MATNENLATAFAGESQANRKYTAFAKKADEEGLPQVARLFRAAAAAETVHALAHFRAMGGVKSTAENLQAAAAGEAYEFTQMYPGFVQEAEKAGMKAAHISFKNAMAVEVIHHGLYNEAIAAVKAGKDLAAKAMYVCEVCGNTVGGAAPDKCGVCGAPKTKFSEIR